MVAATAAPPAGSLAATGSPPAKPLPGATQSAPLVAKPQPVDQRLASLALDNQDLSQIRGGFETSSGVVLNFAFQQATFVNHNLVQNVVVPTLTIAPGQGATSVAGSSPVGGATPPNVNVGSLAGLGVPTQSNSKIGSATVLPNGTVQTQVSVSAPIIQALVNSGMTSVVSNLGNSGLTTTISNTANNRVVQQLTTIDIGVSGLSGLVGQTTAPNSVLNRLNGLNAFR